MVSIKADREAPEQELFLKFCNLCASDEGPLAWLQNEIICRYTELFYSDRPGAFMDLMFSKVFKRLEWHVIGQYFQKPTQINPTPAENVVK